MKNTNEPSKANLEKTPKKSAAARRIAGTAAVVVALILGVGSMLRQQHASNMSQSSIAFDPRSSGEDIQAFPIPVPTYKFGIVADTFVQIEGTIRNGEFLADILLKHQVSYPTVDQLVRNADSVFNVRQIRAGKPYTILTSDSSAAADYFVYEPSIYEYVVFDLKRNNEVTVIKKPITTEVKTAEGQIESSLWNTMIDQGLSYELASKMEDALQWSISFYHIQKGDAFKVVYEQNFVEGSPAGIGQVHAAYFKNMDKPFYAIYHEHAADKGFYDLEGRPMKKSFLKSPVQHSRISSFYNLNRFHPILKRRRPHYGTDYAAPHGTPIRAVGSGVISQASYTSGNGNFVKIKHRDNIETQYLHMSKFAKGIKPGAQVDQGDIIGYVGSTGLATGPHVCFRFWKDGKQINHLNLTFPPADPLPESEMPTFLQQRDKYLSLMNIDPATAIVVSRQDDLRDVEKLEDKSPKVASGAAATSTTPGNSSQED